MIIIIIEEERVRETEIYRDREIQRETDASTKTTQSAHMGTTYIIGHRGFIMYD